jgi:ribonuclease III
MAEKRRYESGAYWDETPQKRTRYEPNREPEYTKQKNSRRDEKRHSNAALHHDDRQRSKHHRSEKVEIHQQPPAQPTADNSAPSKSSPLQTLDAKYPAKLKHAAVEPYDSSKPLMQLPIPETPPIKDASLLRRVFTHRSYDSGRSNDFDTYERLEVLGDAYLEVIATRIIYARCDHLTAGQISQCREGLIKNETLATYARLYGFDERLRMLEKEKEKKNKKNWTKVMGDVFEAYVGALVLDSPDGFAIAEKWLEELWAEKILESRSLAEKDYGNAVQDLWVMIGYPGIKLEYKHMKEETIKDGIYTFYVGIYLTGWGFEDELIGTGEGKSMKMAKNAAATDAMEKGGDVIKKSKEVKAIALEEKKRLRELEDAKTAEKAT